MAWEEIEAPISETRDGTYVKWAKAGQTIQGYVCYYNPQGAKKYKKNEADPDQYAPFIDVELSATGHSWDKNDMAWTELTVGSHALVSCTQKALESAILVAEPAVGDELRISVTEKKTTPKGGSYCLFKVEINRGARQPTPAQAMVAASVPSVPPSVPSLPGTATPTPPVAVSVSDETPPF